jgi:hypothetical protein
MTRSKLSSKVILLATGIGLSTAAFAGSQPAAAQDTFPAYNVALGACPAGTVYDPIYGCTTAGADDYGYYGYPNVGGDYGYPNVLYGRHGHGFGHTGIGADGSIVHHGMGFHHSVGAVHFGGTGFAHGMGVAHVGSDGFADRAVNVAHLGRVGFAHGMGVAHVGGFGHTGGGFGGFHGGGGFGGGGHR